MTAFVHWLPFGIKRKLLRYLSLWGIVVKPKQKEMDAMINDIRLLKTRAMRELFPDAAIIKERFLGLTKSIIAARLPQ